MGLDRSSAATSLRARRKRWQVDSFALVLRELQRSRDASAPPLTVVDYGAGSGALVLPLAFRFPTPRFVAGDATENRRALGNQNTDRRFDRRRRASANDGKRSRALRFRVSAKRVRERHGPRLGAVRGETRWVQGVSVSCRRAEVLPLASDFASCAAVADAWGADGAPDAARVSALGRRAKRAVELDRAFACAAREAGYERSRPFPSCGPNAHPRTRVTC